VTLEEKEELRDPKYSWRRFAFFNPSAPHQGREEARSMTPRRRFTNRATSAHEFESTEGSGFSGQLANKRMHRIIFSPYLSRDSQAVDLVTCE